jgi:hypothetical protein
MSFRLHWLFAGICLAAASCDSSDRVGSRGPIVLGDPATIVTETDSQYLRDFITDIHLPAPQAEATVAAPTAADTTQQADTVARQGQSAEEPVKKEPTAKEAVAAAEQGLTVDFGEITVFIPNIETRTYSGSPKSRNSAAVQLTGGKIAGNSIRISGKGKVERINQRYETSVRYKHASGTLLLESLNYTSDWKSLKAGREVTIVGLEEKKLQYKKATPAQIRTAVTKAARAKKLSKKKEQDYLNGIRNIRSVNQKPLDVVLRTVIWEISGRDSKGRAFKKELRIDMSV